MAKIFDFQEAANQPRWKCNQCGRTGLASRGIPKKCPQCKSPQIWHPRTDVFAFLHKLATAKKAQGASQEQGEL